MSVQDYTWNHATDLENGLEYLENNADAVTFRDIKIKSSGVRKVGDILLKENCRCRALVLQNVGMNDKGAQYLAQCLTKNSSLQYLSLERNNQLTDDAIIAFVNCLEEHNKTITTLNVLFINKILDVNRVRCTGLFLTTK